MQGFTEPLNSIVPVFDQKFTGTIDELRLWNTARTLDQIQRDQYVEKFTETPGLMLYCRFKKDENNNTAKGPRYFVRKGDGSVLSYLSKLGGRILSHLFLKHLQ